MNIRPKTKRRVIVLAVAVLVLVGAGVGVYARYVQQHNARVAEYRAAAMRSYAAGDYAAALPDFDKYLTLSKTAEREASGVDAEALFAYGKSRSSVELPGGRHLLEAKNIFQRYLALHPGDERAETMLLEIYPRLNHNQEAVTLADDVLLRRPGDVAALKAKVKALIQRGLQQEPKYFTEALAAGEKLNAVAPQDLEGHLLTQLAMASAKQPADEVIARAKKQVEEHPGDPRFELVLASAYVYSNKLPEASQWLRTAAARKAPDAKFVDELVVRLDALGMFRDALPVLERAAADLGAAEPALTRRLVQRQWQAGQYDVVARRLEGLDPASVKSDPALLGLRALALYALDRGKEASDSVDALARRGNRDSAAYAWATALKARFGTTNLTPKEQLEKYKSAIEREPGNPIVHYFRGDAYAKLGEGTLALDAWTEAARRAPSWAAPRKRMAAVLTAEGRAADAVRAAEDAYKRAPDDFGIVVIWAQAAYELLETAPNQKELERLARTVEDFQRAVPGEPNTLPIYAAVLVRTGKPDAAAQVVRSALASEPAPSPEVLARLAAVSRDGGLGLDDEISKRLSEGVSAPSGANAGPGPAFAAAMDRFDARRPQEGLDLLTAARAKAGAAGDTLAWRLALAQYLDVVGDGGALRMWTELADQSPRDLAVQSAALRARCRMQDREFWKRTIARVKDLTVENSQLWRLEEMRWMLSGPELSDKDQARVMATLAELVRNAPSSPEPRRLLAAAYERAASAPAATAQQQQASLNQAVKALQDACDLRPADVGMVAELARLTRAAGRPDDVLKSLDRAAARPRLDPASRLRLAELYAQQGQPRRAIELAAPLGDEAAPRLAKWHRALGEDEQAAATYGKLLDAPTGRSLDAQTILDAAGFFADRGQPGDAEQFLAKLDTLPLQPGVRELVRAKYAERKNPEDALNGYQAAAAVPGATPGVWRELAGFHLRHRRFAESAAAADEGLSHYANDADLLAIKDRAHELEAFAQDASVQPLLAHLSFDPRNAPAAELLAVLRERRAGKSLGETVAKLRAAADRYPHFLPLQVSAARAHLEAGEPNKAEQVARRAAASFPEDIGAVRLLASVYAASGKSAELREAAMVWRRLSPRDTLEADLLLARVQLNGNDAAGAADRLQAHARAEAARASSGDDSAAADVIDLYARALIAQGKAADAATLLEPLAQKSAAWRRLWLDLAGAFRSRDREAAANWIARIEPSVPNDAPRERASLARAWYVVGREFDDRDSLKTARDIAERLTSDDAVAAEAWTLLASCDEGLGNLDPAEREYRKALQLRPGHGDIMNNLAYVLLLKGDAKSLEEAKELSGKAVGAGPGVAGYYDTLARIEMRVGAADAAVTHFRKALELDAGSLEAMIGLAEVLSRTGRREEARQQLVQIDEALKASPRLPAVLNKQLDTVRASVQSPVQSGRVE